MAYYRVMRAVTVSLFLIFRCGVPSAPASQDEESYDRDVRPILKTYCMRCHAGEDAKGKIDLSAAPSDSLLRKMWSRVYTGQMPPPGARKLPQAERDKLTGWIENKLSELPRVVMRRLNRVEYRNTVRDLMGVDFDADLPSDDIGYGFDNIGDVLSLPPVLMERYLEAARKILDRAVLTPEARTPKKRAFKLDQDPFVLYSQGEGTWEVKVEHEAEYELRVTAAADQAGPELAKMQLRVDDQEVTTFEVKAVRGKAEAHVAKTRLKRGAHRVAASFINDYYKPQDPDPKQRDRNLILHKLEVEGPLAVALPESHTRIFVSTDARELLAKFLRRAFRRTVKDEEIDRYVKLFEKGKGESFEKAMLLPLQAALVSPHFLFRIEPDVGEQAVRPLTDEELASRLSYFLWSSMPDDELLDLAAKGELRKSLAGQVRRMLRDPRSTAFAENFGSQWLQTRRLEVAAPDPGIFPTFDEDLRQAMMAEPVLFLESIVREDRSCIEILDSNYTFVNERLAKHYGIEGVSGPQMRRVRVPDRRRGGVLTMAGVLTSSSMPTRTSPVKRGKWVLEVILGTPPPPPLPDAPALKEQHEEKGTLRERLERHRSDARCASCHATMDPIGFGFENYDALGAWRESEDTSATLPDGRSFTGPVELKALILEKKDEFVRCLVEKMLTYALGRGLECADAPVVRRIAKAVVADEYRITRLILEIVQSHPFQNRRNRE